MKNLIITSLAALIILAATSSQADNKTPITETTYSTLEIGCSASCFDAARKIYEEASAKVYCDCTCGQMSLNARHVVQAYALKYEDDMTIHLSEIFPNYTQINSCKASSGLKELLRKS